MACVNGSAASLLQPNASRRCEPIERSAAPPVPPVYADARPLGALGSWNPCCNCFFSSLPDALIASEIFSHLSRSELGTASAVCSRFSFLAESPVLHRKIETGAPVSGTGLLQLLSQGRHQHTVSLRSTLKVESHDDCAALDDCSTLDFPRLTDLDLSGSKHAVGDSIATFVSRNSASLRRLNLDGVTGLSDAHLTTIFAGCSSLRHLSVAHCPQLSDTALHSLAASPCASSLLSLNLTGCSGMTGTGLMSALVEASTPRPENTRSRAASMSTWKNCEEDAGLRLLPSHGVTTSPSPSSVFSGSGSGSAGSVTLRLRHLRIRGLSHVNDPLLVAIAKCAPLLCELDAGAANPFGSSKPSPGCSDDSGAGVASTSTVTRHGLNAIARRCRGLLVLRLQGRSDISDDGIAEAVTLLPHLTTLDLRGCRRVAGGTVAALCAPSLLQRSLVELRLCGAHGTTDAHVGALACALPRLSLFDLSGCKSLSLAALRGVARQMGGGAASDQGVRARPTLWIGGIPSVLTAAGAAGGVASLFPRGVVARMF